MDWDCKTMSEGLVPAQMLSLFYNETPRTPTWDGYDSIKMLSNEGAYTAILFNEDDMRLFAEIAGKIIDEYVEEIVAAFAKIGEAMSDAFNTLQVAFKEAEEINMARMATPPKKYGMSLHRCSRRTSVHYNYIPRAPRNLPYMRRSY